jgi:hypothetical protein
MLQSGETTRTIKAGVIRSPGIAFTVRVFVFGVAVAPVISLVRILCASIKVIVACILAGIGMNMHGLLRSA